MKTQIVSIATAVVLAVCVCEAEAGEEFAMGPHTIKACEQRTSAGVPLLQGFQVDSVSGDHHLRAFSVDAMSDIAHDIDGGDHRGALCITYRDDASGFLFLSGIFSFRSRGEYFNETRPGVIALRLSGSCDGGECTFALLPPAGDYVFVLIGFDVRFTRKAHHLSTISILPSDDQDSLSVSFSDYNEDDAYDFAVSYAWVPATYVRNRSTISGTRARDFVDLTVDVPAGEGLIRGFMLTFGPETDHHIDEIGVSTYFNIAEPRVEARFNDDEDEARFAWRIDIAAVETNPVNFDHQPPVVVERER